MLKGLKKVYVSSLLGSLFFGYLLVSPAVAQQAQVEVTPPEILMGGQARLRITLEIPDAASLIWPAVSDTLTKDIEIVRFGRPDTLTRENGRIVLQQTHAITAWEEGYFVIPPMEFSIILESDTVHFLSEANLLEVTGVELDPDAEIKDIKSILGVPLTLRELLPYLLGFLFILLISGIILFLIKKRKKTIAVTSIWEKPDIPAHIAAFSSLERLKSRKLWQAGKLKSYFSELTDILRMYLYKRYGIHAMEMTSNETIMHLKHVLKEEETIDKMKSILELADLVKFAKFLSEPAANERAMELAFDFVECTKKEDRHAD